MSSAISNSSARRRRTAQPKVQENTRREAQPPPQQSQQSQQSTNDYDDETIPILGVKESIMYLSNKLHSMETYLQKTHTNTANGNQNNELTSNIQDMKRTIDELSLKLGRVDLSIEKINLVLKLHDTYINKIKNMVEFENIEQVTSQDIKPQLLEVNETN